MRTKKTVGNTEYEYYYAGDKLIRMTIGENAEMDFFYDYAGQPYAVKYNGTVYYYILNQQGDVVRLISKTGTSYGTYRYDAWGNILYQTNSTLLNANPLRYRGYVYDSETGFYYLGSRYYDPEIGRFINADGWASTGQGILGLDMFSYCGDNPIARSDDDGTKWINRVKFVLHAGNVMCVAVGIDTAAIGARFLDMKKDSYGVYHADFNCWQQYFGYNNLYDVAFNMCTSMKKDKFAFSYNGKGYTIWVWKGNYINLGSGAELAIYSGNKGHRTVDKKLAMNMSLKLSYKGKTIINYSARHWWITGFNSKYLNKSASSLTATFVLQFNNSGMFAAFKRTWQSDVRWSFSKKDIKQH